MKTAKGYFDAAGFRIGSQRKMDLIRARIMGAECDVTSFTRLRVESRVSLANLQAAFLRLVARPLSPLGQPVEFMEG